MSREKLYCRMPIEMTKDELREHIGKGGISKMNIHFACNPKKTKCELNDKLSVRRVNWGKEEWRYTLHIK